MDLSNLVVFNSTLNFEFLISGREKLSLYGRAGLASSFIMFDSKIEDPALGGVIATSLLTGSKNHHFEFDSGVFIGNDLCSNFGLLLQRDRKYVVLPLLDFGYRFQKPGNGTTFRIKIGTGGLGIGVGYSFG